MQSKALTPADYIAELPEDRKKVMEQLRKTILDNLPEGFQEGMGYGMLGYAVPHSIYPKGYHCNPKDPLPFMGLASQKNFIAFYHMGVYADKNLYDWFVAEYGRQPWTIYGVLPTHMSVSTLTVESLYGSLAGFIGFYTLLLIVEMYLMVRFARQGPGSLGTGRYDNEVAHTTHA